MKPVQRSFGNISAPEMEASDPREILTSAA